MKRNSGAITIGIILILVVVLLTVLYITHGGPSYPVPRNPLQPSASIPGFSSP